MKKEKVSGYVLVRGCWHGESRGWLTRNWAFYVIGLGSILALSCWSRVGNKGKKMKIGKLAITTCVLIVLDPLLRNCLASCVGNWRHYEVVMHGHVWSVHGLYVYSVSQMVFLEEDTGNSLDIWIILNQLKAQGKNILCMRDSKYKNRILSRRIVLLSSTHYINDAVVYALYMHSDIYIT